MYVATLMKSGVFINTENYLGVKSFRAWCICNMKDHQAKKLQCVVTQVMMIF